MENLSSTRLLAIKHQGLCRIKKIYNVSMGFSETYALAEDRRVSDREASCFWSSVSAFYIACIRPLSDGVILRHVLMLPARSAHIEKTAIFDADKQVCKMIRGNDQIAE